MSRAEDEWKDYLIDELGISVQFFRAWPVLPLDDPNYAGLYQQVNDTSGIVFIRYGKEETVAAYVRKLGGMMTKVSKLSDRRIMHRGKKARRVTVALDRAAHTVHFQDLRKGAIDPMLPAERDVISVLGFRHRGKAVLAGYRMPDNQLKRYEAILERVVNSVAVDV